MKLKRKKTQVCAGDLDELIAIQSRALATDYSDGEDLSFTNVLCPWAMIETLKDFFIIDEVTSEDTQVTHRFTIRFPDEDVSGEKWVLFNSKRYRIVGQVNLEERCEWMQLLCTQRGSDDREAASA